MVKHFGCLLVLGLLLGCSRAGAGGQIIVGAKAPDQERYAARELQRYLYQLTGERLPVVEDRQVKEACKDQSFLIGQTSTNTGLQSLMDAGQISITPTDPGAEGYLLRKLVIGSKELLVIAGSVLSCDRLTRQWRRIEV